MISTEAFFDEVIKIAEARQSLGRRLLGVLVEPEHVAAKRTVKKISEGLSGPSPDTFAQLKQMKLRKQLDAMKKAKGISV